MIILADEEIRFALNEWEDSETDDDFLKTDSEIEMRGYSVVAKAQARKILVELEKSSYWKPEVIGMGKNKRVEQCLVIPNSYWRNLKKEIGVTTE